MKIKKIKLRNIRSYEDQEINFDYKELFYSLGARTITEEVNNKINDSHYGVSGHNIISELFYNDIINKL